MPFLSLLLSLQKYLFSFAVKSSCEHWQKKNTADERKPGIQFVSALSKLLQGYQNSPQNWESTSGDKFIAASKNQREMVNGDELVLAVQDALDFATMVFQSAESIVRALLACAVAGSSEKLSRQVLLCQTSAEAMALLEGIAVSFVSPLWLQATEAVLATNIPIKCSQT